jgi:GNAT superfamily N-acetyltransferase
VHGFGSRPRQSNEARPNLDFMSFHIRDAQQKDLQAVGQLAGRLVRMHHDYDPTRWMLMEGVEAGYARYFASQLGNPGTIILVAEDDESGEIVGYTYASLVERSWNELRDACGALHDAFVVERARRHGLARSMLLECLRRLTALGAPFAVSTTAWRNETSQALLRSIGFRPAAIEFAKDLK